MPDKPLPDEVTGVDVLVALARLIRRLHDAADGWAPPPDAVWGGIPGEPVGVVPMFRTPELVSHQDYAPGNVVFRDGLPAALIHFDLGAPDDAGGRRRQRHALVGAVDSPPRDRAPALVHADIPERVRAMADAYGMTPEQRAQVVPVALRRASNSPLVMRAAAEVHPAFRRWWDAGLEPRLRRTEEWLTAEAPALAAALR